LSKGDGVRLQRSAENWPELMTPGSHEARQEFSLFGSDKISYAVCKSRKEGGSELTCAFY
jgi:hypothetical protein